MAKKIVEKSKDDYPFSKVNNLLSKFSSWKNIRSSKKFYLVILILGILLLAVYKKSWFIAAMVNGSPVTNLELQMKLNNQFKAQTLNQLIEEKIILDEASKNNAIPNETEIDQRIKELEIQVGGSQTFDGLLSQQGLTRSTLRNRLRLTLAISKLYEKEATISAEEVTKFVETSKNQLQATDSAGQEKEAYDNLKNQKLSQIFSEKFQELRKNAKISIF